MKFKKWVKSIQTAGYNGARTVVSIVQRIKNVKNVKNSWPIDLKVAF